MKYDQPVWQLMHACADAMPDVFRYDDVRAWFGTNFPEVGDATLRAHVVGLTEGGTKHSQFRRRSPIFRRVARGEYAPIPLDERGESPDDAHDEDGPPLVRFQATRPGSESSTDETEAADAAVPARGTKRTSSPEPASGPQTAADFWPFPAGSDPAGSDPAGSDPAGSDPAETDPAGSDPAETDPAGSDRAGTEQAKAPPRDDDPDRRAFERGEASRLSFETDARQVAREAAEQAQLEREEGQLRRALNPLWDDVPTGEPNDLSGPGGIVIVRAPSLPAQPATSSDDGRGSTAPAPVSDLDEPEIADAIVLGSVGDLDDRLAVPAPARDAFRDLDFRRARRAAEVSGARWFVLSADHGLLEPTDWMSPDDTFDATIEPRHRAAWAAWVVARLESLVGTLDDLVVQVEAPDAMGLPVISALLDAGAAATTGPVHTPDPVAADVLDPDASETAPGWASPGSDLRFARAPSVAGHLADAGHAVGAGDVGSLPEAPGLYAWLVDKEGARSLNRALMLPVRAGVIFVGHVGPEDGRISLREQIARVQLQGRARSSTFRMTLATALSGPLGLRTIDDPRLQTWMTEHLSVSVWVAPDVRGIPELSDAVTGTLRPPLNLDHVGAQPYRRRLFELGARIG